MKRHIALTGYRGCGKTSVGRKLAKRLALPCLDTDLLIESAAGMAVADIFRLRGEAGFRELEAAALRDVLAGPPAVIATGGGIILREENRARLREDCLVIWLNAAVETVFARIHGDKGRPPLTGLDPLDEIRTLMAAREPLYAGLADLALDTGRQPFEAVVEAIAGLVQKKTAFGEFSGPPACVDGVADCLHTGGGADET